MLHDIRSLQSAYTSLPSLVLAKMYLTDSDKCRLSRQENYSL